MLTPVILKEHRHYHLDEIEASVREIFASLQINELLRDKQTILLKPNLLGAHHPDKAVTTHPIIVEAVIRVLQSLGKQIIVGDSPGGTVKASAVWQATGMAEVCAQYGVPLYEFGISGIVSHPIAHQASQTDFHGETALYFDQKVYECEAIINLAKMKTHSMMLYTGAVKNLLGTVPGLYKSELHRFFPKPTDFGKILTEIYRQFTNQTVLHIIDGIMGMDGEGPSSGTPKNFGVLIASTKGSVADSVASSLMGFKLEELPYLVSALEVDGFTNQVFERATPQHQIKFANVNLRPVKFRHQVLEKMPVFLQGLFAKLFVYYPAFKQECQLCQICITSCPVKALSMKEQKIYLDPKKCIKCMCCHEMCPSGMVYLKKGLLAKIIF